MSELATITLLETTPEHVLVKVELDPYLPLSNKKPFNNSHSFELKIEQLYGDDGKKISFTDLITPYIDNYFYHLRYEQAGGFYLHGEKLEAKEVHISDETVYLADSTLDEKRREEYTKNSYERRLKWLEEQNQQCLEWFDMTSEEFYNLDHMEQTKLRKENNIFWKNGGWEKCI